MSWFFTPSDNYTFEELNPHSFSEANGIYSFKVMPIFYAVIRFNPHILCGFKPMKISNGTLSASIWKLIGHNP
jgi:hypothetical protein